MFTRRACLLVVAIAAFVITGCGDDKKAPIPTDLNKDLPKVATPAGGGAGGGGKMKPTIAD